MAKDEQERRLSEKLESAIAIYEGEDCEPTLGDVREWRDRAAELEAEVALSRRAAELHEEARTGVIRGRPFSDYNVRDKHTGLIYTGAEGTHSQALEDLALSLMKEQPSLCLIYCDMEGFALGIDGELYLLDECGNCAHLDPERFEVLEQAREGAQEGEKDDKTTFTNVPLR